MKLRTLYLGLFLLLITMTLCCQLVTKAQLNTYNFHSLDITHGLNDGIVRCIGQDKYGYIWIGTVGALNRYDGSRITRFVYLPNDSNSISSAQPRCMHNDKNGRFWIGSEIGLMEYDFKLSHFKHYHALDGIYISYIESINQDNLLIVSRNGVYKFNIKTQRLFAYNSSHNQSHELAKKLRVNTLCKTNNLILIGHQTGLIAYNCSTDNFEELSFNSEKIRPVVNLGFDQKGILWMIDAGQNQLIKSTLTQTSGKTHLNLIMIRDIPDSVVPTGLVVEEKNGVWFSTRSHGLYRFNEMKDEFISLKKSELNRNGLTTNSFRNAFKDNEGIIWLACDVEGVNYFKPEYNLFKCIMPFPEELQRSRSPLGRAITVDQNNNVWMGNHDGLSRYNPLTKKYTVWKNKENNNNILYSNIIRSLHCDRENNIWIGTGSGVNKFNSQTQTIEFISEKLLPKSWYNAINEDKSGNVWFSTNDSASLYWHSLSDKKYYCIAEHPLLKKYSGYAPSSYVFEDSKSRLWISYSRKGLVVWDKINNKIKQYQAKENNTDGIIGNQIIQITEDKNEIIWVSTFNGVTGINVEKNTFMSFNTANGFTSSITSTLALDSMNRLWVGVNGALTMIDTDRKTLTRFTIANGLPSVGFHEHASCTAPDGSVWMPTYNGYFNFDPNEYKKIENKLPFYISTYSIFEKENYKIDLSQTQPMLELNYKQNSFTFHITAISYLNQTNTWYAYKLDGFEEEWHYTHDAKAVYTNVDGGNYTFLYKASLVNDLWDSIEAKKIIVKLDTVFYKTLWFKILSVILVLMTFVLVFTYRSRQQRKLYDLTEKAQALEKDKAMVMYESLKQQLNPHFLFNSLSSLKSLIKINPREASTFLENLSKSYRYILKHREHETTLLSEEITFAENYIVLQKSRHEKGFEVHFRIEEEVLHRRIVPVTLQNLIENAIKHNIMDEESPLIIDIFTQEQFLYVRNNLQKKKSVETSNRIGLTQLQNFYTYLSSVPLEITETETHFQLKIPLL